MEVLYREAFLRDLKKLKKQPVYSRILRLAFEILPATETLRDLSSVKSLSGHSKRYRIRVGEYRVGFEGEGSRIELIRVLHRRDFYRYFP